MAKPGSKKDEDTVSELILKLLIDPDDECFLGVLNRFSQNKQLTKFHKLLFGQQIEVQQNLDKKRDLIEQLKKDWTADRDEEEKETTNPTAESEITYQFLYSTLSSYGKLIANLPFQQKLDLWSTFLKQDLTANHLCSQLFSVFLLHFDATSNKITPLVQSRLDTLIERTNQLFDRSVDLTLLNASHQLIRWLELVYNWGQFLFLNKLYSKDKSTKLIDESASGGAFTGYALHLYKEASFWKKFIKQSLKKEEQNLEITELAVKLIVQNLLFVNSSAIGPFRTESSGLEKFNREATGLILQQIRKYPSLVFYLNVEQFYELFSDDDLAALFGHLFTKYTSDKEAKYLKFLSQNYFKCSKRVQILAVKVFIRVLADVCSENEVQNQKYLDLLNAIRQKEWPSDVHSSIPAKMKEKIENDEFSSDLTEIAAQLDGLTPTTGNFKDERLRNLFQLLQCCVPLKDLLFSNQCLLLVVSIGFLSAYRSDSQLSVLALNVLTGIFSSSLPLRLFDVYPPSSFVKKLFVALAPFNVNCLLPLLNSVVFKFIFRCFYFGEFQEVQELLTFFSRIDDKLSRSGNSKAGKSSTGKPTSVEELQFVLRAEFLIEMHKELERKRKHRKGNIEFLNSDEMRQLFSANIEQCWKQLDSRLHDSAYSNAFKVGCIQGALQFFNLKDTNLMSESSLESYFHLSIKLAFDGIEELTVAKQTDTYGSIALCNYLEFLLQNETIYSSKMSKLELIQRVWTRLVFKPLNLKPFSCQTNGEAAASSGDEATGSGKRKSADDHRASSKRMKEDDSAISGETVNIEILLQLTKITLKHCSAVQLGEFLNSLLTDLKEFNSDFLADSVDFGRLRARSNLLVLIKIIFQNVNGIVANEPDKLAVLKGEFIEALIVQVVSFAQNVYLLKIETQTALDAEEAKEDASEEAKKEAKEVTAGEIIGSRSENELKLEQTQQAQLLALEAVESILNNFRPLGNLTSQQVNYLIHVCVLADLTSYQSADPTHFAAIFNVIYSILNRVLVDYKHTVTSAFSAYVNLICALLENLCKISFQIRFVNFRPDTQRAIERCSVNFQHLLLLLARHKEYTYCTSNIITRFIREMQNDLIYSTIKHRILIGIYKLLNSSQSGDKFQFIYSRLNQEGRQMFEQIHENYDKFYRYKGYV